MDFFYRFGEEGEEFLRELCEVRHEETIHLEFKESSGENGRFSKSDKASLGKELSAFANSDGGLLIWGVSTRKSEANLDQADQLKPIENISRFHAEAIRLCAEYLSPRHDNIQISCARCSEDDVKGYLCISVARSDRRPHMSYAKDDRRYYKRIQDSAYVMEHFDIEDQMSRKQSASLEFVTSYRRFSESRNKITVVLEVSLYNNSEVTAEHSFFDCKPTKFISLLDARNNYYRSAKRDWRGVYSGQDSVINPRDLVHVADLNFDLVSDSHETFWFEQGGTQRTLAYRFGCKDRITIGGEIDFRQKSVIEELAKNLGIDMHPP